MNKFLIPFFSALVGGIISVGLFNTFSENESFGYSDSIEQNDITTSNELKAIPAFNASAGTPLPDLTVAAENSLKSVVHVRTIFQGQDYYASHPLFDLFYGRPQYRPTPEGTGSGVIISDNGYIVTNNHVVKGAHQVKITLHNKEVYDAKVIGLDPSTDLALLKIEANDLPYLPYGNSDDIKVGEWVLAVGNPFNLNSTVTAGIISAKGRDINILGSDPQSGISPVEAFIQTDAAVNPGNSGGALVNAKGELIGINAAIKSNTGTYMGYSFAIPVNLTKKIVGDLMEFGTVQRAFIGVSIQNINEDLAKQINAPTKDGIYVAGLAEKGSAEEAGIKTGDIITHINNRPVKNVPELQEKVSQYRPGDEVKVKLIREGKPMELPVVLRNQYGSTDIVENTTADVLSKLGGRFSPVNDNIKNRLGIGHGVQVTDLVAGKLMKAGVRENFIILRVDGKKVSSPNDLVGALSDKRGGVLFEGIYPNGRMAYYGVGI
jgi:Do/DeqQ family serine protease